MHYIHHEPPTIERVEKRHIKRYGVQIVPEIVAKLPRAELSDQDRRFYSCDRVGNMPYLRGLGHYAEPHDVLVRRFLKDNWAPLQHIAGTKLKFTKQGWNAGVSDWRSEEDIQLWIQGEIWIPADRPKLILDEETVSQLVFRIQRALQKVAEDAWAFAHRCRDEDFSRDARERNLHRLLSAYTRELRDCSEKAVRYPQRLAALRAELKAEFRAQEDTTRERIVEAAREQIDGLDEETIERFRNLVHPATGTLSVAPHPFLSRDTDWNKFVAEHEGERS